MVWYRAGATPCPVNLAKCDVLLCVVRDDIRVACHLLRRLLRAHTARRLLKKFAARMLSNVPVTPVAHVDSCPARRISHLCLLKLLSERVEGLLAK
ncbi:hypothetical protein [Corynebacterium poyangense]|uniref:hypothetical protein n=1 Tax=Corynebacterium poyangense TaxID=2684405 RepID=UPI00165D2155|nr:hypothetical protein [Corynebacterium poyangense]